MLKNFLYYDHGRTGDPITECLRYLSNGSECIKLIFWALVVCNNYVLVLVVHCQALSLYHDASDLCRRALNRRPMSADDAAFFKDSASLVSGRAKMIEDTLVAAVERHLLDKNGLRTRYTAINNGSRRSSDGGEWLRTFLSRCSEPFAGRTDLEDVPTTDATIASSSSSSSLTGVG